MIVVFHRITEEGITMAIVELVNYIEVVGWVVIALMRVVPIKVVVMVIGMLILLMSQHYFQLPYN